MLNDDRKETTPMSSPLIWVGASEAVLGRSEMQNIVGMEKVGTGSLLNPGYQILSTTGFDPL